MTKQKSSIEHCSGDSQQVHTSTSTSTFHNIQKKKKRTQSTLRLPSSLSGWFSQVRSSYWSTLHPLIHEPNRTERQTACPSTCLSHCRDAGWSEPNRQINNMSDTDIKQQPGVEPSMQLLILVSGWFEYPFIYPASLGKLC